MKKKLLLAILAIASISQCMLVGCDNEAFTENNAEIKDNTTEYDYQIYCINEEGDGLESWGYDITSETLDIDSVVREVFAAFESEPIVEGYSSARPETLKKISCELEDKVVKINCDKYYDKLDSLSQLFFKTALVMTLTQIEGVDYVYITVKGQPLKDSLGNPVGYLGRHSFVIHDDFIGNTGIDMYTTIYYPNDSGNGLVAEAVRYVYDEQQSPAMCVIELLKEKSKKSGNTVIPKDADINNLFIKDGICYIDFDENFNDTAYIGDNPELILYSLVNSLSEIFEVTGVQITINGVSDVMFRDEISLDQIFRINLNLVD